jgi:hypothetical protein
MPDRIDVLEWLFGLMALSVTLAIALRSFHFPEALDQAGEAPDEERGALSASRGSFDLSGPRR